MTPELIEGLIDKGAIGLCLILAILMIYFLFNRETKKEKVWNEERSAKEKKDKEERAESASQIIKLFNRTDETANKFNDTVKELAKAQNEQTIYMKLNGEDLKEIKKSIGK